jgi:hypothetical protein
VPAHGGDDGSSLATGSFVVADGVIHLRGGVGRFAYLPGRHPDVRQAADSAGDVAVGQVQLMT